jgi:hypothetical protein
VEAVVRAAYRALCLGIGGGGDVVGALGVAEGLAARGVPSVVGGVSWERRVVDPRPGPRRLDEVVGAERLSEACALAGPSAGSGPPDVIFAEGHMAGFLGEPVLLVDPNPGPAAIGRDLLAACAHLGCDLVVLVDVGGDILAHGDEAGLASPLCDSVLLAAHEALAGRVPVLGAVFGPGCDGELTTAEVLERLAELAAAGGLLGAWGLEPAAADRLEGAIEVVPTEASAQAVACFRGAYGPGTIRRGRRTVERSPVGALTFFWDPGVAMAGPARLAAAVRGAGSLDEAQAVLSALGVSTELDLERAAAAP